MLRLEIINEKNILKTVEGLKEIEANPTPYDIRQSELLIDFMHKDFKGCIEYFKERMSDKQPKGWVPDTTFLLFNDDKFVGILNLRHNLNEFLMKRGGNVAYQIIPSERGHGFAREGLKLLCDYAHKKLRLKRILVTCNSKNIASYKTMTGVMKIYGGEKKDDIQMDAFIEKGVWIDTNNP